MLDILPPNSPPKCFFSHVALPTYIDDKQPPSKRKPFSCLLAAPCYHTVDVLTSQSLTISLQRRRPLSASPLRYARLDLKLRDILTGSIYDGHVRTGNTTLLAVDQSTDVTILLQHGVLHLELPTHLYSRAGLVGKPIPHPGRKHAKHRYAIEVNLRLPTLMPGKKGFKRLLHAADNALDRAFTFLLFDRSEPDLHRYSNNSHSERDDADASALQTSPQPPAPAAPVQPDEAASIPPPLAPHHPLLYPITPSLTALPNTLVPLFPHQFPSPIPSDYDTEAAVELLAYLSTAMLISPRVRADDTIDPALSRWRVPDLITPQDPEIAAGEPAGAETGTTGDDGFKPRTEDLARLRWRGFLDNSVVASLFAQMVRTVGRDGKDSHDDGGGDEHDGDGDDVDTHDGRQQQRRTDPQGQPWAAMKLESFDGAKCMIFVRAGEAMVWEFK